MNWFTKSFSSTIGRKFLMSLSGLFLVSFLFVHLGGNLLLFKSDQGEAFNIYSHFMTTNTVVRVLEIVLILGFLSHTVFALWLTYRNKVSRPVGYAYTAASPGVSWFSRNMGLTGVIILVFLVLHIRSFWYEYKFGQVSNVVYIETPATPDGQSTNIERKVVSQENYMQINKDYPSAVLLKDMYEITLRVFSDPLYVGFYVLSMALLGMHLNHGFQSAFRTIGVGHRKYMPLIKGLSLLISLVFPIGFALLPVYLYFIQQ